MGTRKARPIRRTPAGIAVIFKLPAILVMIGMISVLIGGCNFASSPASDTPSLISTPTAQVTPVPTQTPLPSATVIPTLTPAATNTPTPDPDERYALIAHTNDPVKQQWLLDTFETRWFLDYTSGVAVIPTGYKKLIYIGNVPGPSREAIRDIASQAPGSVWYVVGEPNRRAGYTARTIVSQLHDLYALIREADPTAKITSPSILNFEFTCNGCGGYQKGKDWIEEFRSEYLALYGVEPEVDIWAIDVYPIDWENTPTVDHQIAIEQIEGLREYLDTIPDQQGKPIWITELGLHWGYSDIDWTVEECIVNGVQRPAPGGIYETEQVIGYLREVFDWLDANATGMDIERWFMYTTYRDITTCSSDAYAGLTLLDGPDVGANLTRVGEYFKGRVMGMSQ